MSGKNISFNDKKIRKSTFYKNKKINNNIEDIDVNNILVSKKESYGNKNSLKYFIGYNENDNDVIRPLCIRLPQMTGYARKFDENATMSLIVKDKQLLKNYTKIWGKIEKIMKIDIITDFHSKKMPKEKAPCKCLLIIMIDSVIKANKKYYPRSLLEECKYVQEKIKIENYINEDLEIVNQIATLIMKLNKMRFLIMMNNLLKVI